MGPARLCLYLIKVFLSFFPDCPAVFCLRGSLRIKLPRFRFCPVIGILHLRQQFRKFFTLQQPERFFYQFGSAVDVSLVNSAAGLPRDISHKSLPVFLDLLFQPPALRYLFPSRGHDLKCSGVIAFRDLSFGLGNSVLNDELFIS